MIHFSFNWSFALDVRKQEKVSPFSPLLAGGGSWPAVGLYREGCCWWRQQGVGCGDIKKAPGTSVSGAEGAATYSPACAVPSA